MKRLCFFLSCMHMSQRRYWSSLCMNCSRQQKLKTEIFSVARQTFALENEYICVFIHVEAHVCLSVYYHLQVDLTHPMDMGITRVWTMTKFAHCGEGEAAASYINIYVLTKYYFIQERGRERVLRCHCRRRHLKFRGVWAQIESAWFEWSKFTSLLLSDQCSIICTFVLHTFKSQIHTECTHKALETHTIHQWMFHCIVE